LKELNSPEFINVRTSMVKLKTVYRWLANNDKPWLIKTNKKFKSKQKLRKPKKTDKELDDLYSSLLEKSIAKLIAKNGKRRITQAVLKETHGLKPIFSNLSKFPKCQAIIKSKTESIIEYKIRKVKKLVESAKKERMIGRSLIYKKVSVVPRKFSKEQLKHFEQNLIDIGVKL